LGDGGIAIAAQLLQDFGAIHAGHVEIQKKERRRIVLERLERFDSVRRLRADETRAGEDAREKLAARRIIVSYQNSFTSFFSHPFSLIRNAPVSELYFFLSPKNNAAAPARRGVQFYANDPFI
jgi:hypothetical protein